MRGILTLLLVAAGFFGAFMMVDGLLTQTSTVMHDIKTVLGALILSVVIAAFYLANVVEHPETKRVAKPEAK